MSEQIDAQSLGSILKLLDKETLDKITEIVKVIDVQKVKHLMDAIEVTYDGITIKLKI